MNRQSLIPISKERGLRDSHLVRVFALWSRFFHFWVKVVKVFFHILYLIYIFTILLSIWEKTLTTLTTCLNCIKNLDQNPDHRAKVLLPTIFTVLYPLPPCDSTLSYSGAC